MFTIELHGGFEAGKKAVEACELFSHLASTDHFPNIHSRNYCIFQQPYYRFLNNSSPNCPTSYLRSGLPTTHFPRTVSFRNRPFRNRQFSQPSVFATVCSPFHFRNRAK
jgi:hypothetical protein